MCSAIMRRMGDMGITRSPSTGVYAGLEARPPDGRTVGACPELGTTGPEPPAKRSVARLPTDPPRASVGMGPGMAQNILFGDSPALPLPSIPSRGNLTFVRQTASHRRGRAALGDEIFNSGRIPGASGAGAEGAAAGELGAGGVSVRASLASGSISAKRAPPAPHHPRRPRISTTTPATGEGSLHPPCRWSPRPGLVDVDRGLPPQRAIWKPSPQQRFPQSAGSSTPIFISSLP